VSSLVLLCYCKLCATQRIGSQLNKVILGRRSVLSSDPLCRWVVAAACMDGVVGIDLAKLVCQSDSDLAEGIVVEGMSRVVTQRIAQLQS